MMHPITGLVLAGGMGRRMDSRDKGLVDFRGRPMVAHVIDRLRPQVETLIINANRNRDAYAAFGYPVIADRLEGFAGPLAGLHAGLLAATTPWVVSAPCDTPFLPDDLVARLAAAIESTGAEIASVRTETQTHPVFALVACHLAPALSAFLHAGGRKIDLWFAQQRTVEVAFPDEAAFANINTPEDLTRHASPAAPPGLC
ncbi:MAG: molybdenum cofactor guanylyltransferase MobA [Casimicrobiaceae bacterium]